MKLSVIIPIYNVERYIRECLESILNQTFKSLEIILVNDGTRDSSIDKIQDLIQKYDNIKLINKENGGLSSARNAGLQIASGDYISFIDSDDYIEPSFLENLYKEAIMFDLDVVIGGFTKLLTNSQKEQYSRSNELLELGVVTGKEFLYKELSLGDYRMEVWTNLYRREFLQKEDLYFVEGLLHEDEEFTPKMLWKANRVKLINTFGYIYRQREESIMTVRPKLQHIESILFIIDTLIDKYYVANNLKEKLICSRLIKYLTECYEWKLLISDIEDKKSQLREIQKRKLNQIINYDQEIKLKTKLKYLLLNLNLSVYYKYLIKKNQI